MIEISKLDKVLNHLDGLTTVIFDLDDTLYSEKQYVKSGYKAIAEKFPCVPNLQQKLWNAFENKQSAIDEVLKAEGLYSDSLKQECLEIYRFHKPDIKFYDGVEDILIKIRKDNLKIGIITDGRPEGQNNKIQALNLTDFVDYIIITDELGGIEFRKPNETAFIMMQKHFNCPFDEMCYIGDNLNKDFIAPDKLGMRSIYFKNKDGIYF